MRNIIRIQNCLLSEVLTKFYLTFNKTCLVFGDVYNWIQLQELVKRMDAKSLPSYYSIRKHIHARSHKHTHNYLQ